MPLGLQCSQALWLQPGTGRSRCLQHQIRGWWRKNLTGGCPGDLPAVLSLRLTVAKNYNFTSIIRTQSWELSNWSNQWKKISVFEGKVDILEQWEDSSSTFQLRCISKVAEWVLHPVRIQIENVSSESGVQQPSLLYNCYWQAQKISVLWIPSSLKRLTTLPSWMLDESPAAVSQRIIVPVEVHPSPVLLGVGCDVARNSRRQTNMSKPELWN